MGAGINRNFTINRHRPLIITVIGLVILNLVWWAIKFNPFQEQNWKAELLELDTKQDSSILVPIRNYQNIVIQQVIYFNSFFTLIDSLALSSELPSDLGVSKDLIIVSSNPWILDSLRRTDYREAALRGKFIDDLNKEPIIPAGATIRIPDSLQASLLAAELLSTRLVLNIPEFRLRLIRGADTILNCPVRVGRNEQVYLEAVGQTVDLRTPVGKGRIHRVWRTPKSVNLHTGEEYIFTRRDDNRVTKMPPIPSLEPEINHRRNGKMIHATTNPVTLGKAFSHGCVGVSEADMWTIYFNMPVGAAVEFRYDLESGGKKWRDIYGRSRLKSGSAD